MNFNKHFELKDKHAYLGASKYHWLNYSDDKLVESYKNFLSIERGTELHEFARRAIELGIKLPKNKKTLNMYVNDAIGFRMTPEQPLYYSDNCFGTADAIAFSKKTLRVHDLKTGVNPASMNQLKIYDALFCLEYDVNPKDILIINRIYQLNDCFEEQEDPEEIESIEHKIIHSDKLIQAVKMGEE